MILTTPSGDPKGLRSGTRNPSEQQQATSHTKTQQDFTQEKYLRDLEAKLGKTTIYQLSKKEGHILVGLSSVQLADKLIEEGLNNEDSTLRAFPLRKRAERIFFGNVLFFVEDADLVSALRPFGPLDRSSFSDGNARKETASLNLEATIDDPELLKRVITGDETWIYGFDSETTKQASEWRFQNEPRPKKARKAPSKVKVMLTVFFDYQGIVYH
ncbi:hypothetical protein LAZ67_4002757 [Cordylochernes scorpioides]|uniref:Uncharacterized protein n=1 Tax=Cordylochernes scorpioides TaxID=51811 RepID=A0ABY6KG35_9ARAC|nr:hypothetical protein LAZ67_4002757 [Cordylochernes scorpioides]